MSTLGFLTTSRCRLEIVVGDITVVIEGAHLTEWSSSRDDEAILQMDLKFIAESIDAQREPVEVWNDQQYGHYIPASKGKVTLPESFPESSLTPLEEEPPPSERRNIEIPSDGEDVK